MKPITSVLIKKLMTINDRIICHAVDMYQMMLKQSPKINIRT